MITLLLNPYWFAVYPTFNQVAQINLLTDTRPHYGGPHGAAEFLLKIKTLRVEEEIAFRKYSIFNYSRGIIQNATRNLINQGLSLNDPFLQIYFGNSLSIARNFAHLVFKFSWTISGLTKVGMNLPAREATTLN